jgi:hypothetical protein
MKFQIKYFVSVFLVLSLLAGWVTPAYAAGISSVTPNLVFNDAATTITVTGSGFVSGAVVSLKNYGDLSTSFDNDTQLKAVVRPGIPASTYTVVVTNPDLTFVELPNGLTVADPSPLPTSTPLPTATTAPFGRPQIVIGSYRTTDFAQLNKEFKLKIGFNNAGTFNAINTQAVFTSADAIPTDTGGVLALGSIPSGGHVDTAQTFFVANSIYGKSVIVIEVALTYYDEKGAVYSDKFTVSVAANGGVSGDTVYPTSTPTGVNSAQLVITSYASTVDPLQPGEKFELGITVQNMGNTSAKQVTMIVGGGSSGTSGGTPQPGGVSGGSGEFTNFAPVGSSNIQSLGDIPAGGGLQILQNLVVNVSTNPGAYPMKITFSYVNAKGEVVNDDQVITLLVYSLPNLDVSFYSPPESFFAGQPGALPIQVVNLGKRSAVLGNMKIEAAGGTIDPATTLVGSLDPGGYFTFDSTLTADVTGPMELNVTIEYTDDFNQARKVTRTLNVTVGESFTELMPDPAMQGMEGTEIPVTSDETFLHKVWRFALGLFGLDSAPPSSETPGGNPLPGEEIMPLPSGGGGGKG